MVLKEALLYEWLITRALYPIRMMVQMEIKLHGNRKLILV
jgi:hypothetical protein